MKRILFSLALLPLLLSSCNGSTSEPEDFNSQTVTTTLHSGDIGSFNLLTPENGYSSISDFTFTWEEASNADYYAIEIATTINFISDDEDEVYVRESNISQNKYVLMYSLPKKDRLYYWKVTAINKDHKQVSEGFKNFFYESDKSGEIPIEIEDEQDWTVHKEGAQAQVSIDRNDFFGNGKNSLVVLFDKEHTSTGNPKSDGWMVITKAEDRELYGTNAFYFNFYYTGQQASVLIRVLDYDGEYWHKEVQIANNAKQTVLLKYEEFTLRTAGTNIFNRKFDWEHIRYFEIVFERTFGDGVCILSNIKGVNFANYKDMFVDKINFKTTDPADWTYENFNFDKTISEDGSEITLSYTAKSESNPNGFNGYGFQNINLYKYFSQGDALRMKVKYTGTGKNAMFYFRILEEDNDRWQFKTSFNYFVRDEYKDLIIPLKAFQRTDYLPGDGAKQFYFIQKLNVGLADNYTTGSISIKDMEVVTVNKLEDIYPGAKRVVGSDGLIENFNNYDLYTQIYYQWQQGTVNKDEAMKLDTIHKLGGSANPYCGEFDYKADMEMATYELYLDTKTNEVSDKNAFSLWLKDASVRFDKSIYEDISDDDIAVELTIQLTLASGEWYRYTIDRVKRDWHKYTIKFSDFTCINEKDLFDTVQPIEIENIIHMGFGMYYKYMVNEQHIPCYASANPVYIDEIYFTKADATSIVELPGTMVPDSQNKFVLIEDMESYDAEHPETIFEYWSYGNGMEYNLISLSDEVSSEGGENSIKMHYVGKSDSVSYGRRSLFARRVQARGITLDIKGDGKATVYVNLNWRKGEKLYKMRAKIEGVADSWNRYTLGLDLFPNSENESSTDRIGLDDARNIESVSFGIVNNVDTDPSDIYIDNIKLNVDCDYVDRIVTPIV